jgi:hypothetical protein
VSEIALPETFPEVTTVERLVSASKRSAETDELVVPLIEIWPLVDLMTVPW